MLGPPQPKYFRQFADIVPDEEKAEFLNSANKNKSVTYTAPPLILRRNAFVEGIQSVLENGLVSDADLFTLFDALDWTADSDRDGFVSWEDLSLDSSQCQAKELTGIMRTMVIAKVQKEKQTCTKTKNRVLFLHPGQQSQRNPAVHLKQRSQRKSLRWQLDKPDEVLSYHQIALPKENRVLTKQILPGTRTRAGHDEWEAISCRFSP